MNIASEILGAVATVVPRRLRNGPRHPNWSLPYEVGVEVCGRQVDVDRILTPAGRVAQASTPVPPQVRKRLRFETTTLGGRAAEQHTPRDWDPAGGPTLLYIHGGAYFACSPGTHRSMISRIAAVGRIRCIAPDYRLAPEHKFPAALDDCLAAYRELLARGQAPERLYVGGDSAGGALSLAVLQRVRDAGEPLPAGALLLSPWVDVEATGGTMLSNAPFDYLPSERVQAGFGELYLGEHAADDPLVSPIHADLHGLPPMHMFTGALEIFAGQNRAFAERARAHGVALQHTVATDEVHVYPLLADISPAARRAFHQMAELWQAVR